MLKVESPNEPRVLFVGGEPKLAATLGAALVGSGCAPEVLASVHEARQRLQDALLPPPSLLTLDVARQRASSISLIRWIRGVPSLAGLPIVVVAGEEDPRRDVRSALNAGADAYLTRPVEALVLRACIAGVLRQELDRARESAIPVSPAGVSIGPNRTGPRDRAGVSDTGTGTGDYHSSEWELFKAIEAAMGRCLRSGRALGLAMIGMTPARPLNDVDLEELVIQAIERARTVVPGSAALKLFEREVFCAVLPEVEEPAALKLANDLLSVLRAAPYVVSRWTLDVPALCGLALAGPPFVLSPFQLIDHARHALERASERGGVGFWVDHMAR